MDNVGFYAAAATVIPLLLIAVMATRGLRYGELRRQPKSTVLFFGLPIIGELASFSFLFFAPVSSAVSVILAIMTWAGLLSQLALGAWWLAELIRRDLPSGETPASDVIENQAKAQGSSAGPGSIASEIRSPPISTDGLEATAGSSPGTPKRATRDRDAASRGSAATERVPGAASRGRRFVCPMCGATRWSDSENVVCSQCGGVRMEPL